LIYAVIVAGGSGKRMNSNINKQYLNIKGKPLLYYSIKVFSENPQIDGIVLVVPKGEINYCQEEIVNKYNLLKIKAIVEGGGERQNSVYNGLKQIKDCSIVIIHDGARPFVNDRMIEEGIKYAMLYGAASCGMPPKDTIKSVDAEGFSIDTFDRNKLFSVQTPQSFKYDLIFKGHENLIEEGILVTDDTMIIEKYGGRVYLYEGSYSNIKVTTPEDLLLIEKIAESINLK